MYWMRAFASGLTLLCSVCLAPAQDMLMTGAGGFAPVASTPAYTGPIDINGSAYVFWSTRAGSAALASAATKLFRVCDSATVTTCADSVANTSTGAASIPSIGGSPCNDSTNTCVVTKFYDQTGNNNCGGSCDLVSSISGQYPLLKVSCQNSLPCAVFNENHPDCMVTAAAVGTPVSVPYSSSLVFNQTIGFAFNIWSNDINTGASVQYGDPAGASNVLGIYAGNSTIAITAANNTNHAAQTQFGLSGNNGATYLDGTNNTSQAYGNQSLQYPFYLGADANSSAASCASARQVWSGNVFELGIWTGDTSSHNSAMNSNQHTYWNF